MEWLAAHERFGVIVAAVSLVLSLGGMLAAPIALATMRADYFAEDQPPAALRGSRWAIHHWTLMILKNALGVVLIILGIILALPLVPGPGILTLLVGLSLVNFPGKRKLERKIASHPRVLPKLNALRAKAGREPLRF